MLCRRSMLDVDAGVGGAKWREAAVGEENDEFAGETPSRWER